MLVWMTLALAGTMVVSGFTVQHQALITRQMRYHSLAMIEVLTMVTSMTARRQTPKGLTDQADLMRLLIQFPEYRVEMER